MIIMGSHRGHSSVGCVGVWSSSRLLRELFDIVMITWQSISNIREAGFRKMHETRGVYILCTLRLGMLCQVQMI